MSRECYSERPILEDCLALDLRLLKRLGLFQSPVLLTFSFASADEPSVFVSYDQEKAPNWPRLLVGWENRPKQSFRVFYQVVPKDGYRRLLECSCGRTVRALYSQEFFGRFSCRHCSRLVYRSTRQSNQLE